MPLENPSSEWMLRRTPWEKARLGSVASPVESSTRPVDNDDGRHGRSEPVLSFYFSIEASRPVQQVVVTKNAEEDAVINDKALVGFPVPAVKGTRSRSIRRSCGPFGGLSKVPRKETFAEKEQREVEEREKRLVKKEGQGAQRRACEQLEGRVLGALPVHEAVDDEVGQVRLGEKEGGF